MEETSGASTVVNPVFARVVVVVAFVNTTAGELRAQYAKGVQSAIMANALPIVRFVVEALYANMGVNQVSVKTVVALEFAIMEMLGRIARYVGNWELAGDPCAFTARKAMYVWTVKVVQSVFMASERPCVLNVVAGLFVSTTMSDRRVKSAGI